MLPAIQTPQRPSGAPSTARASRTGGPPSSSRGTRGGPSSSKLAAGAGPMTLTVRRSQSNAREAMMGFHASVNSLLRDEDLFRSAIEAQCSCEQNDIWTMIGLHHQREREDRFRVAAAEQLRDLSEFSQRAAPQLAETSKGVAELRTHTESLARSLSARVEAEESAEHKAFLELQVENAILKRDLATAKDELEQRNAECQALHNTLRRRLLRTSAENEILRQSVRDEMKKHELDFVAMQKVLEERIDLAILSFDKNTYEGALRSLQERAAESRARFREQAATLQGIVGAIGARDSVDEAKTMHSNLPNLYRKQLQQQSREHLLNLIDVLSFEDGIVECVGRALYAIDPTRTQQVFN